MFRAALIASTGMAAQQLNVEVISNNIANLNSTGYKRRLAEFQDLLYQSINRDAGVQTNAGGNLPPTGSQLGLGVKNTGIFVNNSQGTLLQTNSQFDLAIQGRGFFQATDSDGNIYYTRAGRLGVNDQGIMVDPNGFQIEPAIALPTEFSEVTINAQGEVLVTQDGNNTAQNLGRLVLTNFINEAGLRPEGNNLFTETQASGQPIQGNPGVTGYGTIQQGFIENSNVDAVLEITTLITAQRAYELNSRVISSADEMLNAINQIR